MKQFEETFVQSIHAKYNGCVCFSLNFKQVLFFHNHFDFDFHFSHMLLTKLVDFVKVLLECPRLILIMFKSRNPKKLQDHHPMEILLEAPH